MSNQSHQWSHQRLLLRLKAHRIGNDIINWIEKWLTHRRQRVIVDVEISHWTSVLNGISIRTYTIFNTYINDISGKVQTYIDDIYGKVVKFADDTKVFRKVKRDADKQILHDNLDKLVKRSDEKCD